MPVPAFPRMVRTNEHLKSPREAFGRKSEAGNLPPAPGAFNLCHGRRPSSHCSSFGSPSTMAVAKSHTCLMNCASVWRCIACPEKFVDWLSRERCAATATTICRRKSLFFQIHGRSFAGDATRTKAPEQPSPGHPAHNQTLESIPVQSLLPPIKNSRQTRGQGMTGARVSCNSRK